MRRQIQGLHLNQRGVENKLEGLFLVRVDQARYRWHPQKPFVEIQFAILEPKPFETRLLTGRLYCTERALWKLNWFLRDFGYDTQLLKDDQVDEKALRNLRGVVRTSYTTLNGRCYQNLDAFAPEADWEALECTVVLHAVHSDRENVYEAQVFGVLGEHGCEHARDNVAKPELESRESLELDGWIRRVETRRRNDRYKWLIQRRAKRHKKIRR